MLSISSAGSTSSIPPVIIHLISGQKVSALSFLELSSFSDSLSAQVGMVTSSSFLSGGDLSVRPSDESQKDKLLALVLIDKFQVSCSLPKSVTTQKGIIRGVPFNYPEDEILSLLENQNVTKVERLKYFKNSNFEERALSSSVTLIFNGSIPSEVRIGLVNFRVERFYPHTHRCKNCFHVGHLADLEGNCKNGPKHSPALCFKCATSHDESVTCNTFCINCKSSDHNSRSNNCPIFQEMNAVLRLSIDKNIPVGEARTLMSLDSSPLVKKGLSYAARLSKSSPFPTSTSVAVNSPLFSSQNQSSLQRQIDDLKATVEKIQSQSIPALSSKIDDVENDFLETCKTIETDFDVLNKKVDEKLSLQDRMAVKIDMIFEKMNLVLPPVPSNSSDSDSAEKKVTKWW